MTQQERGNIRRLPSPTIDVRLSKPLNVPGVIAQLPREQQLKCNTSPTYHVAPIKKIPMGGREAGFSPNGRHGGAGILLEKGQAVEVRVGKDKHHARVNRVREDGSVVVTATITHPHKPSRRVYEKNQHVHLQYNQTRSTIFKLRTELASQKRSLKQDEQRIEALQAQIESEYEKLTDYFMKIEALEKPKNVILHRTVVVFPEAIHRKGEAGIPPFSLVPKTERKKARQSNARWRVTQALIFQNENANQIPQFHKDDMLIEGIAAKVFGDPRITDDEKLQLQPLFHKRLRDGAMKKEGIQQISMVTPLTDDEINVLKGNGKPKQPLTYKKLRRLLNRAGLYAVNPHEAKQ